MADGGGEFRTVCLTAGTNIAADPSPDRTAIVMDLLGMVWLVPSAGGAARALTDEMADATLPVWSPDGRHIAFQSQRDGNFHLYVMDADGQNLRQLTAGPYDHREPRFSPDGATLAFTADREGRYALYTMDLASYEVRRRTDGCGEEGTPAWSADGTEIAVVVDGASVDVVGADGARRRVATETDGGSLHAPFWSPDGRVGYVRFGKGRGALAAGPTQLIVDGVVVSAPDEDVFPFAATFLSAHELLYTADGQIRRRDLESGRIQDIPFEAAARIPSRRRSPNRRDRAAAAGTGPRPVRGIVGPALSPDGTQVVFCALGDLWLMSLGATPRRVAGGGWLVADPAWSPDGTRVVYTCDRAGNPDLWVHELATATDHRLTDLGYPAVGAAWSRDGGRIAFQDHEGALRVLTLDTGDVATVTPPLWAPGRASWNPDGTVLALAAGRPYSKRFREGVNTMLTVNLSTGATEHHSPVPHRSLSTRGYDGPLWSPDGRYLAFVMSSLLWVVPVDRLGRPQGEPRQVTDEVTDAPSWSGDSSTVLYLHNGELRMVAAAGGVPRTVPVPLTYTPVAVREPLVIHAGRAWDGLGQAVREEVDIVVEGDRIVEVGPHRDGRAALDATSLTALPGLADMHVHGHMKGRFYGSRQGRLLLCFGVTTIRAPGDPAYHALADRESVAAGTMLGPRYFGTGEGIDGSRVHYSNMRAITSLEELEREMQRADALDYDLVKLYVRLPWSLARAATEAAHRQGRWVTGHYLYPAVLFGANGKEHFAGTNRLGYAQTQSRLGRSYSDVTTLICETGATITPTLQKAIGGTLIAGTDAPLDLLGIGLHTNLRALVAHGLRPYEALRTATVDAASALGHAGVLGELTPGARADLVLVRGDPLRDIAAAADVVTVVARGVRHEVDELLAPFPAP